MRISLDAAIERYGKIENGIWANEAEWCILFKVPNKISATWINSITGKPTTHIYLNKDLATPLSYAMTSIIEKNLISELKTFDGAFMIRDVREEPGLLSTHAYACGIDINAAENKLGSNPKMSPELVKCFKNCGFTWGGAFKRKDGMHFSLAWE